MEGGGVEKRRGWGECNGWSRLALILGWYAGSYELPFFQDSRYNPGAVAAVSRMKLVLTDHHPFSKASRPVWLSLTPEYKWSEFHRCL